MALKGAKAAGLRGSEIKTHIMRHLDPGNNLTHVIKVHIASCSQAMDNLLHPGAPHLAKGEMKRSLGWGW
jgi:hypothetical protein